MNKREQLLAIVLGGVILVAVAGFGGYVGFYLPIQTRHTNAAAIEKEVAEKETKLAKLKKDMPRLADAKKRSLPADADLARQEYEAAIGRLLMEAKVPKGYSFKPKSLDSRTIPEIGPKKPAYQRIGVEITMKKVDLATLTDFLERYYKLNLLHQITRLQVKRNDAESNAAKPRSGQADRPDLDVTLVSEAIILDGAEARRSLLSVPVSAGAVLGSAGFHHLASSPVIARSLKPLEHVPVLAEPDRDYFAVLGKDVFHGPIPPPPPPPKKEPPKVVEPEPEPPPVVKEDIAGHIKLIGITRRSDGTATGEIKDIANNLDYIIDLKMKDGKPTASVLKYYYLRGKRRTFDSGGELDISDDTSSTARKFKVVGLDSDGVILTMKDAAPAKVDPKKGGGGFGRRPTTPPPPVPITAIVGAVGSPEAQPAPPPVALPDKIFAWRVGQTLRMLKPLSTEEGQAAVKRAETGFALPEAAVSVGVTPAPREVAEPGRFEED